MARIHVLTDDLLFGSRLQAELEAGGHEVTLGLRPGDGAQLIVVDLTHDGVARLSDLPEPRPRTLAFFSHVETDMRADALAAGIELVVPRSRIAREASSLVAGLLATAR